MSVVRDLCLVALVSLWFGWIVDILAQVVSIPTFLSFALRSMFSCSNELEDQHEPEGAVNIDASQVECLVRCPWQHQSGSSSCIRNRSSWALEVMYSHIRADRRSMRESIYRMYSSDMVEVLNGDRLEDFVVDGVSVVMFTIAMEDSYDSTIDDSSDSTVFTQMTSPDSVREVGIWHAPRDHQFKVFLAGDRTVGEALMVVGYNQDHFDIYLGQRLLSPLRRVSTIRSGVQLRLEAHFGRSRAEIDARMSIDRDVAATSDEPY